MCRYTTYLKLCLIGLSLLSTYSNAGSLPNELLNAPIHLTSGESVSLSDYNNKRPVYLKFWATWCQPCRKQMPHFEHAQKLYGDKIKIIGINLGLNDDLDAVKATIREFGLTMPMAVDVDGDLAQKFRLIGTPYHLLFDRNMNLVHKGHDADESLDNKLALVAQTKASEVIDARILIESEPDIKVNTNDGNIHALFFTATWCDWYLKNSRPTAPKDCTTAQNKVNDLYDNYSKISWIGIASRLWTADKDLVDYTKKYAIKHPIKIDKSNRLFHQYSVVDLPTLILIKNDKVIARVRDFDDMGKLTELLNTIVR